MRLYFWQIIQKGTCCFLGDDPEASLVLDELDEVADGGAVKHVEEMALKDDLMLFLVGDEFADELFSGGGVFEHTDFSFLGGLLVDHVANFVGAFLA